MVKIVKPTQKKKLLFRTTPGASASQRESVRIKNIGVRAFNVTVGGGRALDAQRRAQDLAREEAARKAKQLAEFQARQKASREAAQEKQRIFELGIKLRRAQAQRKTRVLTDVRSKDRLRVTTVINNRTKERIITSKNLRTGIVTTRTFERSRDGRSTRETGGTVTMPGDVTKKQVSSLDKKIDSNIQKINKLNRKPRLTLRERDLLKALQLKKDRLDKQKKKQIITGSVTKIDLENGFVSTRVDQLKQLENVKSTQSVRTKQQDLKNELKLAGIVVASTIVGGTVALVTLPVTLFNVAKNPKQLLGVPSALKRSAVEFGQLLRVSPTQAFVKIGSEVLFLAGAGKALRVVGKVSKPQLTKSGLLGKFRKIDRNQITLTSKGKITTISVGGTVKKIAEPLAKQARLAGKKVTAVSAQADRLINLIKTKRIVRKPIPGEADFSKSIKRLLSKFDKGKITRKELITLENQVPLLERSFFADPRGRFRPSRLGANQKDASLIDFLSGDITFRTPKPQILVFDDVRVAKFPKDLQDVQKALRTGKTLTSSQARRLLRFQSKKSGEFKPIGALSKEPEITLAPGEIIKKVKKAGVTLVNGKKVDIVFAKVVKAKSSTTKLLKKSKAGKLTSKELKQLRKNLKKETGFNTKVSSRKGGVRPRARLPKRVPKRGPSRASRAARVIGRGRKAPRSPTRPSRTTRVTRTTTAARITRAAKRPPKRSAGRGPARPPKRPPKKIKTVPPVIAKKLKKKVKKVKLKKEKKQQGFNVFARPTKKRKGQKKPKLIKVNKKPLSEIDAKNLRNRILDQSLARSGKIMKTSGKPQKPSIKGSSGFAKRTSKKFRMTRRSKGKTIRLPKGAVIERGEKGRNFLLDTRGEKLGITLRKRIKQLTKKPTKKRKVKKKSTPKAPTVDPAIRRRQLANLKKARTVKANLAKGRRRSSAAATSLTTRRRIISII